MVEARNPAGLPQSALTQLRGDGTNLLLRTDTADTGTQTRENCLYPTRAFLIQRIAVGKQRSSMCWNENLRLCDQTRKHTVPVHHADQAEGVATEVQHAADCLWIAVQLLLPKRTADHHHPRWIGCRVITWHERATKKSM
nr:hypothetical protein [Metallibacterium scheffleri]